MIRHKQNHTDRGKETFWLLEKSAPPAMNTFQCAGVRKPWCTGLLLLLILPSYPLLSHMRRVTLYSFNLLCLCPHLHWGPCEASASFPCLYYLCEFLFTACIHPGAHPPKAWRSFGWDIPQAIMMDMAFVTRIAGFSSPYFALKIERNFFYRVLMLCSR